MGSRFRSRSRSRPRSHFRSRPHSRARSRPSSKSRGPTPTDQTLYNSVKARVYKQNPVHSAYRSGHVVKSYKAAFKKKYGSSRSPYRGRSTSPSPRSSKRKRSRSRSGSRSRSRSYSRSRSRSYSRSRSTGLRRWFAERWRNQRGEVGYKYKSDVYRPTRRITRATPKTYRELSPGALRRARAQKAKKGRVSRF